ncbi:hypothetical protein UFOVP406_25 [uncultured Caudovirales phage]|uniref:Uncharacterized protein n=1 Tax=uncultured Caudovirales phage TaxID=2100421 RepID=A0A6J5M4U8_9CAUD|nr:hypothetical protein UFOVP406_25 [uncultured Caudovirales phage]
MTDKQTPPDWILIEAAKRAGLKRSPAQLRAGQIARSAKPYFRALCDMIERYEEPPEDRKLLCAREAYKRYSGVPIPTQAIGLCVAAIELYEGGFGK